MKKNQSNYEKKYDKAWVDSFFNQTFYKDAQVIVDRLKESSVAMAPVYAEIEKKVPDVRDRQDLLYNIVLSGVLTVSEDKKILKNELKDLRVLQEDIGKAAKKLITLLNQHEVIFKERRKRQCFLKCFVDSIGTNPCKFPYQDSLRLVIEAGVHLQPFDRRAHFREHIAPVLREDNPVIETAYQKEIMPKLQEVLQVLKNLTNKEIEVSDSYERVLLKSRKAKANKDEYNGADFLRIFSRQMSRQYALGYLPEDFELSPESAAIITICVLDKDDYPVKNVKKALKPKQGEEGWQYIP